MTAVKIKKTKHPDWWVQKSITNCGHEIKIIHKIYDGNVPEHVKGDCCKELEAMDDF